MPATGQSGIRSIDMRLIDDLFGMGGGYVLDFTDRTFAEFFREELGIEIDEGRYHLEGSSKAKRLRYFLKSSTPELRIQTLSALWEYREAGLRRKRIDDPMPNAEEEYVQLIERLGGRRPARKGQPLVEPAASSLDPNVSVSLKNKLIALSGLSPVERGFGYERFLKELFDANGLAGRASFRLTGEQIDGSFELANETYLLEAKWVGEPIGAADLRSFNAKVEDKAAWSRGLFVSDSGFSPEGIAAFGRGKRVICMDGLDLCDAFDRNLMLATVLARKVRRAAESGNPYVRVRDLFP